MTTNIFVYPHPVNVFIIGQLGITVDDFCRLYGHVQSTLASWITRDRKVETLPISFLYSLSLASGKSMDVVFDELLRLQNDYEKYLEKNKRKKKII